MSKLILTVDDSPSMRMLLKASLAAQGYTIESAEDGEQGLERLREIKPDLVITDINMPRMDGFQLIEGRESDRAPPGVRSPGPASLAWPRVPRQQRRWTRCGWSCFSNGCRPRSSKPPDAFSGR